MMNVIIDWKNLRRLYDEINCRCKLNIFQGARVKSLCQMFAASFYGITENKKSANEHLTQTKQRKTLKKNLICAILNTVAQAANFDTIGGNYYVQI